MFTDYNNRVNNIIKDIAYKHGLTAEQGYDIMRHEFEFVKQVINEAKELDAQTQKSVNLMYIGAFKVKNRIKKIALGYE